MSIWNLILGPSINQEARHSILFEASLWRHPRVHEADSNSLTESTTLIKPEKFYANAIDSCTSIEAPIISVYSAPFSIVSKCLGVHAFAFGEAIPSFTLSRTQTTDKHILTRTSSQCVNRSYFKSDDVERTRWGQFLPFYRYWVLDAQVWKQNNDNSFWNIKQAEFHKSKKRCIAINSACILMPCISRACIFRSWNLT